MNFTVKMQPRIFLLVVLSDFLYNSRRNER